MGLGLGVLALILGFPLALLLLSLLLGRLEAWILAPDERAAEVTRLLEQVDETEDLEQAVKLMLSNATRRQGRRGANRAARRWAFRLAGTRRTRQERAEARQPAHRA